MWQRRFAAFKVKIFLYWKLMFTKPRRQAVELGADVIKADPCTDITEYHKVIEIAGDVPVLVRGGGKATDERRVRF